MAAAAVLFYRILLLFDVGKAIAFQAALVLGAGTNLFYYARIPYAVVPVTLLLLIGFYRILLVSKDLLPAEGNQSRALSSTGPFINTGLQPGVNERRGEGRKMPRPGLFLSGLVLGSAVALEYIQIIAVAFIFLYAWYKLGLRRILIVALGGLPMGLLILLYHSSAFGDPLTFPYKYAIDILAVDKNQALLQIDHPTLERFLAVTFGVRRGLFIYSPVLLILLVLVLKNGFWAKRRWPEVWLILGITAAYIVFQASSPLVSVTWGIGPRYAAIAAPFLVLGIMFVEKRLELRLFYWVAWLSIVVNWLLVQRDIEPQHHAFPLRDAARAVIGSGPCSSLLETIYATVGPPARVPIWLLGVVAHSALVAVVWLIWCWSRPNSSRLVAQGGH